MNKYYFLLNDYFFQIQPLYQSKPLKIIHKISLDSK